jgi:hypothetical protein
MEVFYEKTGNEKSRDPVPLKRLQHKRFVGLSFSFIDLLLCIRPIFWGHYRCRRSVGGYLKKDKSGLVNCTVYVHTR